MITTTNLLSLLPSLPQGAARQPGGGAFVLPDGEETVGDDTLLAEADGGERQNEAAGGNGLPDTVPAIDPWLVATLLSPDAIAPARTSARLETGVDAAPAAVVGEAAGASISVGSTPAVPAIGKTLVATAPAVAPVVPIDPIDRPAVAPPIETVADLATDRRALAAPQPSTETIPPAVATGGSTASSRSAGTPSAAGVGVRERASGLASAPSPVAPTTRPIVDRRTPIADASIGAAASAGPLATEKRGESDDIAPSRTARPTDVETPRVDQRAAVSATTASPVAATTLPADVAASSPPGPPPAPARPRDASLPETALRSSALTPLHRDEVATVAALVSAAQTPSIVATRPADAAQAAIVARADPPAMTAPAVAATSQTPVEATDPTTLIVDPATTAPVLRIDAPPTRAATLPLGWRLSPPTPAASPPVLPSDRVAASPISPPPAARAGEPAVLAGTTASWPAAAAGSLPPHRSSPVTTDPAVTPAATPEASPIRAPATPVAAVVAAPPLTKPSAAAAPSGLVFGAARYAAQAGDRRDDPLPTIGGVVASAPLATQPAVAATPVAHAPIDVRHERWPTTMIERIEMIRDAANEVDTRIRLVPDALGAIDVDVRRDGDTLHVRFAAVEPQTRALLQEAAPRLADAADARGLRLSQTTVGGDAGGTAQQHQPQGRQHTLPSAPARASRPTAEAQADADDTRLA